ncbi:hypothetical protein ACOMHN_043093 [Nucella lapillus]
MAKKSVTGSVVLAQSRNRSVEHGLSRTMRRLKDQEQLLQDRHQREMLRLRDFRRQSLQTSGIWCTSFEEELSQDSSASEDIFDTPRDKRDVESSSGGSSTSSSRLNSRRGSCVGNSNEMTRSLVAQSDSLLKLQKPWAYTYSLTSYNSLYKESMQLAEGQKSQLNFRRVSDSFANTSPDHMKMFRSRSSVGNVGQDLVSGSRRPLTGRSTPGIPQRARSSRHRLSLSASVDKTRPKTSVGLVPGAKTQQKEIFEKKTTDCAISHQTDGKLGADTGDTALHFVSAQQNNMDDSVNDGGDVMDILPTMARNTSDSTSGEVSQSSSVPCDPKSLSYCEIIKKEADPHGKHDLSVLEDNSEWDINKGLPLISETDEDTYLQEQTKGTEREDIPNTDKPRRPTNQFTSSTSSNSPERPVKEKKVHIKLTATDPKQCRRSMEIDTKSRSAQYQSYLTDKHAMPSSDSSKRDENIPPAAKTAAEPARVWSSPPTPHRPQTRAESRENNRLKSTSYDRSTRRCSDVGMLRQRSDMTSDFSRSERRSSGSLSRRYSAIDVSGSSSFMKIADQLEVLREFSLQRMIPVDDDEEDWSEEDVSGSPNEVNAIVTPLSGKVGRVNDTRLLQSAQTKSLRGDEKAPNNGRQVKRQNSKSPEHISISKISHSSTNTKGQPSETKKPILSKTSNEISRKISESHNNGEIQNFEKTLQNGVPVSPHKNKSPDFTVFKGVKIHNYVRPQERYRGDTVVHLRREKSMPNLSTKTPALPRHQNGIKPAVVFSKTSRRKVLQELVHRHHQPIRAADSEALPPQLRSRIDEFLKTIEPYCSKPDLVLH